MSPAENIIDSSQKQFGHFCFTHQIKASARFFRSDFPQEWFIVIKCQEWAKQGQLMNYCEEIIAIL